MVMVVMRGREGAEVVFIVSRKKQRMNEDEESFETMSTILEESETIEPKYEVPGSYFLLGS
ncbi:hypothetical protein CDL15_Pgr012785 [Punica granatum]|uniref:Uncharacterized protein n=1 Tax=Punica granatum TaxID=22663 RepID=A0A218XED4_PUNGR|nr:hypothetical protein CDL15_Pgr012785 [Punica granatum]